MTHKIDITKRKILGCGIDIGTSELLNISIINRKNKLLSNYSVFYNDNEFKYCKKFIKKIIKIKKRVNFFVLDLSKEDNKKIKKYEKCLLKELKIFYKNQIDHLLKKYGEELDYICIESINESSLYMYNDLHNREELTERFKLLHINEFRKMLYKKCKKYNIDIITAFNNFPSSKLCNKCGNKITDKEILKKRISNCPYCGNKINKNKKASINLAIYGLLHYIDDYSLIPNYSNFKYENYLKLKYKNNRRL